MKLRKLSRGSFTPTRPSAPARFLKAQPSMPMFLDISRIPGSAYMWMSEADFSDQLIYLSREDIVTARNPGATRIRCPR